MPHPVHRASIAMSALVLTVSLTGCGVAEDRPPAQPGEEAGPDTDQSGVEDPDAAWLAGAWSVEQSLDEVAPAAFAEEAARSAVAVVVSGAEPELSVVVDGVGFVGVVVFGGDNFRFEGYAEYARDDGPEIAVDLVIDGVKVSEDSWTAQSYAEVREDGPILYEASWTQVATRVP